MNEAGGVEDLEEHRAAGGDRRSFIRKAAVGMAGAFAAPVVVGSVLSPASASGPFLSLQFTRANNGNNACGVFNTTSPGGACQPANFTAGQDTAANALTVGLNSTNACGDTSASFTVAAAYKITAAIRCRGTSNTAGTIVGVGANAQTVTWLLNEKDDVFRIVVQAD